MKNFNSLPEILARTLYKSRAASIIKSFKEVKGKRNEKRLFERETRPHDTLYIGCLNELMINISIFAVLET